MIFRVIFAIFLWCAAAVAHAQTYSWPDDLTGSDFKCTLVAPGEYNCPSMSFSKEEYIVITAPITVHVNGSFKAAKNFIIPQGSPLLLDVNGDVAFSKDMSAYMDIKSTGNMSFAKNTTLYGDLNSTNGSITIDKDSLIDGDVFTKYDLRVAKHSSISGNCSYATTNYTCSSNPTQPPTGFDHFLVEHEGTTITCQSAEVTVWACGGPGSGGTCPTTTIGASGTLEVRNDSTNALVGSYNFTIPAGQTYATVMVPYTTNNKYVRFGTTTTGTTCWDGDAASCVHAYNDTGFEFEVPDHVSAQTQTVSIRALRKSPSNVCAAAFNDTRQVSFSCTYVDPSSAAPAVGADPGVRNVTLENANGSASVTLTCGTGAKNLPITFDATGTSQFKLTYPDVGRVQLEAKYLPQIMFGSSTFVTYPKKFEVTWPNPSSTVIAGEPFRVKVTAMNNANQATPNYGRENTPESAVLSFIRCQPATGQDGVSSGTLGSFTLGAAESTNSKWGEVGTIDVKATNADYLGIAANIQGSSDLDADPSAGKCTGLFGRFRPKYFKTSLPDGARTWAYSGEPFSVVVSGFNADNEATDNYDKVNGFSRDITFSALGVAPDPVIANPGPGVMAPALVEVKDLADLTPPGGAVVGKPGYAFTAASLPVKPTKIAVCATDADTVNSNGNCGAVVEIRTGRLRMSNAFGSVDRDLRIPVRAEYWSGSSWLLNTGDSFTTLPITALALSPASSLQDVKVQGTQVALTNGAGSFVLSKPTRDATHNGVGSVLIAANLGATTTDTSCLADHPVTVGAKISWLRSRNGTCNASGTAAQIWSEDPTARASFGVTTRENRATIHVREALN